MKGKTISFKPFFFFALLLFTISCGNSESNDNKKRVRSKIEVKDTLLVNDVIEELRLNMWTRINLVYFDKKKHVIDGINSKQDTFFLKVNYNSLKFRSLNDNHELFINSLSNNCIIDKIGNKFRLIVNSNSYIDTVKYEVYLESSKYLFETVNHLNSKKQFTNKIRLSTFYEAFSIREN